MRDKFMHKNGITSIIVLALSACILLGTAAYAWLGANRVTDSNGIEMAIDVSENLVISDSTSEISKAKIDEINTGKTNYTPFLVTFATNDNKYVPTTHDNTYTTYTSGLKYVTNNEEVDVVTGLQRSSTTALTFADAASGEAGKNYYVDYVVYIASHGAALSNHTLTAKIVSAKKGGADVTSGSLMATSIDFYVGDDVSSSTYKGTANVATMSTNVVTLQASTTEIPLNTESSIKVTMRCYFDGALVNSTDSKAYINSATVDLSKVTLNVEFTATKAAGST